MTQADGDLTIYVGEAGEKYSDPADWRDLVLDERVTPDRMLAVRRGERLDHLRADAVPELAALFAQLTPEYPSQPSVERPAATGTQTAEPVAKPPGADWRTAETQPSLDRRLGTAEVVVDLRKPTAANVVPRAAASPAPLGASFTSDFVRCLTRDFARFSGRADRREFWTFVLGQGLVLLALVLALAVISADQASSAELGSTAVLLIGLWSVFILYSLVPALAVLFRRLHDLGASGWTALVVLVPYLGWFLLLAATLFASQGGDNRYCLALQRSRGS